MVTSDKDGPGCTLEKELADADIVISQPFYPFYLTAVRGRRHCGRTCMVLGSPAPCWEATHRRTSCARVWLSMVVVGGGRNRPRVVP